jgi:cytosine/uracil/thiamine/allantoin permease
MTMGWRESMDAAMAAGLGPEDCEKPDLPEPMSFTVSWVSDELCADGEYHAVRTFRTFSGPTNALAWKHATAWMDAMERRHGKGNVWMEED